MGKRRDEVAQNLAIAGDWTVLRAWRLVSVKRVLILYAHEAWETSSGLTSSCEKRTIGLGYRMNGARVAVVTTGIA